MNEKDKHSQAAKTEPFEPRDSHSSDDIVEQSAADSQPAPTAEPAATLDFASAASSAQPTTDRVRYRILRPHAKGGLGEVFVARDVELNREVALKEIQQHHADDPGSRARFVLEAEVTGGLEHPGIVPVYGLGQYDDGRPYYAMRFIRGDSLQEAVDRFHGNVGRLANPSEKETTDANGRIGKPSYDSLEFRKLLGRFIDVCNAVQYAHSRGVLHRDLKPGNVMLGKYGETLVVDWGLAKVQDRDDEVATDGETPLRPASGSGTAPTQMGSAVGTPAFMPPEQAAGRLDELGPASDVYSLGATLYYVLTGKPAFRGKDLTAVLKQVQAGEFAPPRKAQPEVPKPLNAICLRAMATKPADRYASPQELADDVERFLADEPVSAFAEPVAVKARRWVRKHQTLTAATAAVVLVSVVGLGIFSSIVSGKNAELTTLNRSLDSKNSQLIEANQRETMARELAQTNEQSARQQSRLALSTLASVIDDIQGGLRIVSGGGGIRQRLLKTSLAKLENVATRYVEQATVDHHTIVALFDMGAVVLDVGVGDSAASEAGAAGELFQEQKSAVQLAGTFYRRAHEIAAKLAADDPGNTIAQIDLALSYGRIGDVQLASGDLTAARASYQASMKIAAKLVADDPGNAQAQRNLSVSYDQLGKVQLRSGDTVAALAWHQKQLEIAEKLAADDPGNTQAQRDLSTTIERVARTSEKLGQWSVAAKLYKRMFEIKKRLADADPNDTVAQQELSVTYRHLGDVLFQSRDLGAAEASYQKALEIAAKLAADDPGNAQAQGYLAASYNDLGKLQRASGNTAAARVSYQEALKIFEKLAADDPANAQAQRDFAVALGSLVPLQSDADSALALGKKAHAIFEKLAADDPANAQAQRDLGVSCSYLGVVQLRFGDGVAALALHQKSLEIAAKLAADDPGNVQAQSGLILSHGNLGLTWRRLHDFQKSVDAFAHALTVAQAVRERGLLKGNIEARIRDLQREQQISRVRGIVVGDWDTLLKQPAEALPALLKMRAVEFTKTSRFAEAAQAAAKLRELDNATSVQLYNAACVFSLCAASIKPAASEELTAEQTMQRRTWINDALVTLKQSIAAGWADWSHMEKDSDLDAIRQDPRYRKLFQQMKRPAKPTDENDAPPQPVSDR